MRKFTYVISDQKGLHALNAMQLTKTAEAFKCRIEVEGNGRRADGKKVMAVLGLSARQGDKLTFSLEGADEAEAAAHLEALLKTIL